ncbi:MAG: restriction endonuclease subunit S [Pseudomonadota bacterium]
MSEQWRTTRLSDHTDIAIGGTPSRAMPAFWATKPTGHPWLAISDLRSKYLADTREHISDLGVRASNVKLIPAGSTVMSFKLSVGRTAITMQPMYSNEAIAAFLPRSDAINSAWLYHVLPRAAGTVVTDSAVKGVTLNKAKMAEMTVLLPSPAEQKTIARVLDTLDTTIRQTEAIIEKLKHVKQGLLHDLLTRGIAANGELRPPQAEAPHLYKESPLGWIPQEWECKTFGDLCESSAFGPRFPSDAYDENGPLATLRTTDMDDEGRISLSTMPRTAIKPSVFADHLLQQGDIVISRSGTCGVTGVFNGHEIPVVPGAFLIRFRLRDARLNRFYRRYFNSSLGRPYLERLAVGGVQKNIKGSDVLCLQLPAPTPFEAVKIAERVESVENDVESNQQLLAKLLLQKSGLMDDLLTGRVRVTPLLQEGTASP